MRVKHLLNLKTLSAFAVLVVASNSSIAQQRQQTVGDLLKKMSNGADVNKPITSLPQTEAFRGNGRKKVNLNDFKPPSSDSLMKKDDGTDKSKLEKITDQQISELYKLTTRFKNSPNRGELWLRLAELYVEKSNLIEFRKQGEYEVKLEDYNNGKTKVKPKIDLSDKMEYHRKAIKLYEYFVRDFKGDPKMDQALFFLGYNYIELNDVMKGASYYSRLVKEYPKSPYVEESYFALGDFHFENNRWAQALENYQQVMKLKSARLYPFALYKGAWCNFRMAQTQNALKYMETLIRIGRKQQAMSAGKKKINMGRLENEALRDIIVFYADGGSAAKAFDYFKELTGKEYISYLEKLAYYYSDKGERDSAFILFKQLIQTSPTSAKSFDYQYQIVTNYSNLNKSSEFKRELLVWIKDYNKQSAWYQANQENLPVIENSQKLRENVLRNYVLQNHQTAQNSRVESAQKTALEGYTLYLAEFQDSALYPDIRFFHAELLYDMGLWARAADEYKWVAYRENSKFQVKAALNMMLTLEKDLPTEASLEKRIGNSVEPIPMDEKTKKFVTGAAWYLEKYPTGERALEIRFKSGRLYYLTNNFKEAQKYFRDVVKYHPKSKQAEYSANLLLDIFNIKNDYEGLEETGQALLAIPEFSNSQVGKDVKTVLEKASFKKGQDLEIEKKYGESADQFATFAAKNPSSPLASAAWFNSAVNFERAGDVALAINSYRVILNSKDEKAQEFRNKSYALLAKLYQNIGQFDQAAQLFEYAGKAGGKDPLVPNYYYNAALFYDALGNYDKAAENYTTYYRLTNAPDKNEIYFTMGEMFKRGQRYQRAIDFYTLFIKSKPSKGDLLIESSYRIVECYVALQNSKEAYRWKEDTLALQRKLSSSQKGLGSEYAAKILFERAQFTYADLKKINLTADPAQQQKAAEKKIALLGRLNKELADIIRLDSAEELIASLSLLGQANMHMYDALNSAPLPAGLTAEEQAQYKEGVGKIAEPFLQKAKESHLAAVQRGQELETFTEFYSYSMDMVKFFDPNHHYDRGEKLKIDPAINWMDL